MRYISTRGGGEPRPFSDILLEGLAPDGGLYLPETYPDVTEALPRWHSSLRQMGYAGLAFEILSLYIDDIPADDLRAMCERAYSVPTFSDPAIVPVTRLGYPATDAGSDYMQAVTGWLGQGTISGGLWLAHTALGPTAAFKDLAMQLLGELFAYELARRDETLTILGATSGDTGSAAEYALIGKPRITTIMLSPAGRMSAFQQAQMFSLDDPRVVNVAVDGVFDDCQDLVKAVNADASFKAANHIGAVNSINWARVVAQVVYYVAAWIEATDSPDQRVSFAVPTGNFGNIFAGHVARQMGVPIDRLVLATNENDVLDEFVRTGVYAVRGASDTLATSSPSMDISKASNFERFVFDLLGRDAAETARLFGDVLSDKGRFDLSARLADVTDTFGLTSGTSSHADRLDTIRGVWDADGIVLDPHTADGVKVAVEVGAPETIVLETALPVKFADTIREALGFDPPVPERFAGIEDRERHVVGLPNDVDALKSLIVARLGSLAS